MDQEKIGLFIKEKRTQKNLTQKELADKLNVTTQAVSKWERGKGIPDVSLLDDLSKSLDVSIVEILKGEEVEDKDDRNIQESIKYANKSLIQKINLNIMKTCWTIVIIVLIILALFISKYLVIKYKTYTSELESYTKLESMKNETLGYINTLTSSQGNYSTEEYQIIIANIGIYKELFKDNLLIELENKESINYKDVNELLERIQNSDYSTLYYTLDDLETLANGRLIYNNEKAIFDKSNIIDTDLEELEYFQAQTDLSTANFSYNLKDRDICAALRTYIIVLEQEYNESFKTLVQYGGYNA